MQRLVLLTLAFLAGCGGSSTMSPDLSADACVITFSGAIVGSIPCDRATSTPVIGRYDSGRDVGSLIMTLLGTATSGAQMQLSATHPGAPAIGPWASTDDGDTSAVTVTLVTQAETWTESFDPASVATRGTFSATLDGVIVSDVHDGGVVDGGAGESTFYTVHGTAHITLLPVTTTAGLTIDMRF